MTRDYDSGVDDALRLSAEAARIVLESGGETYRAEDVMSAVASSLGALEPEAFATPTGFMASCDDEYGRGRAVVRRIRKHQLNLDKIARVNALARDAVAGRLDRDGIERELCAIDALGAYPRPLPDLGAAFVTGFFCLLFGGAWNDALVSAGIGLVIGKITSALGSMKLSVFFSNIVGGAFAAAVAIGAEAVGVAGNTDAMIIGSIMLLVPGVLIVNAIRDLIAGDLVAGIARAADAFISAAGISIGVGLALQLALLFPGLAP
ncbi:MAG TPA: threonine/serine exporter family protein [Spirochaetia bacterium]|nr:threonine/serine exporter family protein [Spirochaetaceae bacterium]HRW24708.1 threonine/serine exporter family protein [Spirochaetia bacterium]